MLIALLLLLAVLQVVDCFTTVYILSNGGREANPVMNWLFQKIGMISALVLMKLVLMVIVVAAWNEWITLACVLLYSGVVSWNIWQMKKPEA